MTGETLATASGMQLRQDLAFRLRVSNGSVQHGHGSITEAIADLHAAY